MASFYHLGLLEDAITLLEIEAMTDHYAHPAPYHERQEEECRECGHKWPVDGLIEYGQWSPMDQDDLICPNCKNNPLEDEK
jgi:hypothetical protein